MQRKTLISQVLTKSVADQALALEARWGKQGPTVGVRSICFVPSDCSISKLVSTATPVESSKASPTKPVMDDSRINEPTTALTAPNAPGAPTIRNGVPAGEEEFPFIVSSGGCGGTFIYEDIVLTAAHCGVPNEVWISAYFWDRTKSTDLTQKGYVKWSETHPEYSDGRPWHNNVMVLKLDSPSSILPIELNGSPSLPIPGDNLVAIGHGYTEVTYVDDKQVGKRPDVLMKLNMTRLPGFCSPTKLCANAPNDGLVWFGDSGGPLLELRGSKYVQVGISSTVYTEYCTDGATFADASLHKRWIEDQVCALASNPPLRRCGCNANDFDGIFRAVNAATGPDFTHIVLCPGSFLFYGAIILDDKKIEFSCPSRDCTLIGQDFPIFVTRGESAHELIFRNLVFRGGSIGAFELFGGSATFGGCFFEENIGGAVFQTNGWTLFNQRTFRNHLYASPNGGVYSLTAGTANFFNCDFLDNTARENGGVMFQVGGRSRFNTCKFYRNTASKGGGAVYLSGGATTTFQLCDFQNNTAGKGDNIYTAECVDEEL